MFLPDYTITNRILKNISEIERTRGYIESTFVLPFSQNSLKKESKEKKVYNLLLLEDYDVNLTDIKKHFDSISPHLDEEILKIIEVVTNLDQLSKMKIGWDKKFKSLNEKITENEKAFRIKKIPNKLLPEEILAKISLLTEWLNSDDAKNTHPLIVSGILLADLEISHPYEKLSSITSNLISEMFLISNNFDIVEIIPYQENFNLQRFKFNDAIEYIKKTEDYTEWLDFYLENIMFQMQILKEKYELLEKQSKQQSIPNAEKLTQRQQRIYQYLLDYKFIQNSQFSLLFPDISEDSILRDLRVLGDLGLVVKTGKTKSSKYELKH
jgi:hypothetical protein